MHVYYWKIIKSVLYPIYNTGRHKNISSIANVFVHKSEQRGKIIVFFFLVEQWVIVLFEGGQLVL